VNTGTGDWCAHTRAFKDPQRDARFLFAPCVHYVANTLPLS
jgi:hypothetical protein